MEAYNSDMAPELLESLRKNFESRMAGNDKLKDIYGKVNAGSATYLEANDFALEAGNLLAEVFHDNISESILPDGRMYFNIADRVIRPMMTNNHDLISRVCVQVQGRLNQKAGLGIKAIQPELNNDRIRGIVDKVSEAEHFSDVAWVLAEPIRTFSQSIVDDSIKANVNFQGKAGLYPRIERIAAAGCCEWCEEVAGTYRYPNVPKDVYRRHGHCRCTVEYDPADGKGLRQNVHDKSWHNGADSAILEQRKRIGLDDSNQNAKIEYRKTVGMATYRLTGAEREVRANWKLAASASPEDRAGKSIKIELGQVEPQNIERTIDYFKDQIRNFTEENAVVVEKNGKVLRFIGTENSVDLHDTNLDGARILHNHPISNGIVSFGKDDFELMKEFPTAVYDLVNAEYDYHVEIMESLKNLSYSTLYREAILQHDIAGELQDEAMSILAERGFIRYEKRRIK